MHSYRKKSDCKKNLLKQSMILTKSTKKSKEIFKLTNRELNRIKNKHDRADSQITNSRLISIFRPEIIITNLIYHQLSRLTRVKTRLLLQMKKLTQK